MQSTQVVARLNLDYTPAVGLKFQELVEALQIGIDDALSTEAFFVKLMKSVAQAESQLPEALRQNNFGYSISEGGNYRATIKAVVSNSPTVIG